MSPVCNFEFICPCCQMAFQRKSSKSRPAIFCSRRCANRTHNAVEPQPCLVTPCEGKAWIKGYCSKHYQRLRNRGTLALPTKEPVAKGDGAVSSQGYRLITVGKQRVLEHRYVMELYLERRLAKSEHVHHKNHDRLDNRLENLEVLSQAQHNALHRKS